MHTAHMMMPGAGPHHGPHSMMRHHPVRKACFAFLGLFWVGAITCMLGAVNRGADALKMQARIKALHELPEAFTEEERADLVGKIKRRALGVF